MTIDRRSLVFPPPPSDDPGEPALVALIREEIERDGPITFARFMERALYEPGLGYYATSADRPTRQGDFLTSPELHPLFGWAISRQIDEMWRRLGSPDRFVLREYGAGTGALGRAISDGLARDASPLAGALLYEPVEVEGRSASAASGGRFVGCVLGNEFLDALPVHRVIANDGRLREIHVGWRDGQFVELMGDLSDARLSARFGAGQTALPGGCQAEVNLRMTEWLATIGEQLERGYALLFDYGLPQVQLRSEIRATGTVRAFRGQHVSSDVLSGVGHRDITANVDLDALAADARAAGLDVLDISRQAEFLLGCGIDEIYREEIGGATASMDLDAAIATRAAMHRLVDPYGYGMYAVVVLGKGVDAEPPLRGLAFGK